MPSFRASISASTFAVLALLACQPVDYGDDPETSQADEAESDDDTTTTTTTGSDTGEPSFNCDPTDPTSCPDEQKCTALNQTGTPTYDCVPDDTSKLPFEACDPAPTTGQDGCPSGHTCMPLSNENPDQGLCLQLCKTDGDCELALCSTGPGSQVRVCAAICDPLASACPTLQTCQRVGGSAFACHFPATDDVGTQGDSCVGGLDRGCAEGYVCENGAIIPGCSENNCCTALCDLNDVDPCPSPTSCGELPLDPLPGLESVGACYVPQ